MSHAPFYSIAPMLDYTDRHYRQLARLISPHAELYTEMIVTQAVIHHKNPLQKLRDEYTDTKTVLQLGGSDPLQLAQCALIAEEAGFKTINLNIGCPSPRVSAGRFGVCLMREPQLVAECVTAIKNMSRIDVTIKTRLGVDNEDSYEFLTSFIEPSVKAGVCTFILHARKAWLHGLSPRENRDVPPLNYDRVYNIKTEYPHLIIHLNGGVQTLQEIQSHLQKVDGVMLGRAAYYNPYLMREIEKFYHAEYRHNWNTILSRYFEYIHHQHALGTPIQAMTRHLLPLCRDFVGARQARQMITETGRKGEAEKLFQALVLVLPKD